MSLFTEKQSVALTEKIQWTNDCLNCISVLKPVRLFCGGMCLCLSSVCVCVSGLQM